MACPSGCNNGGGQIRPEGDETPKELLERVTGIYDSIDNSLPDSLPSVFEIYNEWLGNVGSEKSRTLLHTQYHEVEKLTNALAIKW